MTRDEIVTQIQLLLGFRTDQRNTIIAQVNIQQRHLEHEVRWLKYPWFLLTEIATTASLVEDPRVQKPSDWIADTEEDGLYTVDAEGVEKALQKTDFDILRKTYLNTDPGPPCHYATFGDYYYLGPTPDIAYTIRMCYYQQDVLMVDGTDENRWAKRAPNLLIGRTGLMLCGAGNNARQEMLGAIYKEAKDAIETKAFDDEVTNRQYAMGENQ